MTLTLKIILGVVIVTIVGLLIMQVFDFTNVTTAATVVATEEEITRNSIGISGYVVSSGNYLLEEGATMQDLIDKAGGITDRADTRAYFPTATVEKNTTYYIPPRYDPTDICSTEEITKVNINSYTDASELTFIDGIGDSISSSIISYRNENGLYQTLEDVMNVSGIGNATYTKLRNYIILTD